MQSPQLPNARNEQVVTWRMWVDCLHFICSSRLHGNKFLFPVVVLNHGVLSIDK